MLEADEAVDPDTTGLRDHLVSSGEAIDFEYEIGALAFEGAPFSAIIAVAEVDQQVLVALPEGAWNKTKRRRKLDPDFLKRPVSVFVPLCGLDERENPEADPSTKVWLGLIATSAEEKVSYNVTEEYEVAFPLDSSGLMRFPFARALVAVAQDHFTFLSAESQVPRPPGLDPDGLEARLAAIEDALAALRGELRPPASPVYRPKPKPRAGAGQAAASLPGGVDPAVAQQALQAGVSREALEEMAKLVAVQQPGAVGGFNMPAAAQSSDEEAVEEIPDGADGGAAGDIGKAVMQLSKIVAYMHKEKTSKKARGLDAILDRAESGLGKEPGSSSARTKAAALHSLQTLLTKDPTLIYQSLERRLQEDWSLSGPQPGIVAGTASARGWVEYRSRIQQYPSSVRMAWACAGVWDCLMNNRVAEARARAALSVAMVDQQACDGGNWLLSQELSLEAPPPYASFATHTAPLPGEDPHSRLIDHRWVDLFMTKLRDIADYHDKKWKLSGGRNRNEDSATSAAPVPVVKPKPKPRAKVKGKGESKGKGAGEDPAQQAEE